jgi:hypothetical protein
LNFGFDSLILLGTSKRISPDWQETACEPSHGTCLGNNTDIIGVCQELEYDGPPAIFCTSIIMDDPQAPTPTSDPAPEGPVVRRTMAFQKDDKQDSTALTLNLIRAAFKDYTLSDAKSPLKAPKKSPETSDGTTSNDLKQAMIYETQYFEDEVTKKFDFGKYLGQKTNGRKHGFGKIYFNNGAMYEGQWKQDLRHGVGIDHFANNDLYQGSFKNDTREGKGTYWFDGGATFDGWWKLDRFEGEGILSYANGDLYHGWFKCGKRHGTGKYIFTDGRSYLGQWSKDMKNGMGKFKFLDGKVYDGRWKDDIRVDEAADVVKYDNGDIYEGPIKDGHKHGYGTYLFANGSRYQG